MPHVPTRRAGGTRPDDPERRAALRRLSALAAGCAAPSLGLLASCGGGSDGSTSAAPPSPLPPPPAAPAPPAPAAPLGEIKTTLLNDGLASPWSLAFLPDARILVTQKAGSMLILRSDGSAVDATVGGIPAVVDDGQGGLLDVALDPDFATDPWVYFSYSEAGSGGAAGTAVARGRLVGSALQDVSVIFRQLPKVVESRHFGSRLAFRGDKTLFVTLGERHMFDPAQDLGSHLGKVVRIQRDGSVPPDNPFVGRADALPEIWSWGHRNPQGAAIHPETGELWIVEHGPTGGDELNRVLAGRNYGWPLRSYGCIPERPDDGCPAGGGTHAPDFTEPVSHWDPESIAPSGLMFCTSGQFPEWRGDAVFGALVGQAVWRVALQDNAETARERLFSSLGERIRCVRQGPDGWIYLLTDSGRLLRIER